MIKRFPHSPTEYLDIARKLTEIELQTGHGQYFRIWGPDGCIDMDEGHGFSKYLDQAIPIGDDGGGKTLVYSDGPDGYGLYLVSNSDIDINEARFISPTLNDLLVNGVGIDQI